VRSLQWQSALCLRENVAFFVIGIICPSENTKNTLSLVAKRPAFVKNAFQIGFYMIAIIFRPPPPPSLTFPEKLFRCPFHSKSAPRNRPTPQSFDASYAPGG
jgi:hypothetical protein